MAVRRDARAGLTLEGGRVCFSRTLLKHGKDPELRRRAEDIIAAQEREIAQLRAILSRPK